MKKFNYALLVFVLGFAAFSVVSSLSSPAIAFAKGIHSKSSHSSYQNSNNSHDNNSHDNDSHNSNGGNHDNDNNDGDNHDNDNSHDNDSHENDNDNGDDNDGNHDDDSNGHDNDDHDGDNNNDDHDGDDNHNGGGHDNDCPDGQHMKDGKCYEDETPAIQTATIKAVKIICDNESDLPNWGAGGPNITSTTTTTFLASHEDCHKADWTFEWAPNGTANPGDQVGVAGGVWKAFTNTVSVPSGSLIWVREQFKNDYIPFTGVTTTADVSAEIYCNTDVLNYDNYDWINPVEAGKTYNCIAFNVKKAVAQTNNAPVANAGADQIITLPTSSVTLDGSASTDSDGTISSYVWDYVSGPSTINPADTVTANVTSLVEGTYVFKLTVTDNKGATGTDTVSITVNHTPSGGHTPECSDDADNDGDNKIDETDPGCHTDGNPSNNNSYNPNDDSEVDVPQCSNTGDDDNDGLIDTLDPGCHTDGNPTNTGSYDPNDNDETNTDGNGGGGDSAECSDDVDNDGDNLIDALDPGCHTDGNENDEGTYDPNDNDETNNDGNGGGGGGSTQRKSGGRGIQGQVLAASNACGIYVDKYLRVGHANNPETVKKVQTFLNNYMNAGLAVDGVYGTGTETAVRNFQLARYEKVLLPWNIDHKSTGIFYLTTQTEVNNIMCPTLNLPIPANLINFSQNPNTPSAVHGSVAGASTSNSSVIPGVNI